MGAPRGVRSDRLFAEQTILDSLPGTMAQAARKSGFSPVSVGRAMKRLLAASKAHQTGWEQAFQWHAVYAAGPAPDGFTLPSKPAGSKRVRDARHKRKKRATDAEWKKRQNEREARRSAEKRKDPAFREAEQKRKRESYQRNRAKKQKTKWIGGNPFAGL